MLHEYREGHSGRWLLLGCGGADQASAGCYFNGCGLYRIEVTFDTERLPYRKLLEYFFQIHDPTTRNRQGNDIGTSYRSAIFCNSDAQRDTANALIAEMNASGKWPGKIVTEVVPATDFWNAEAEHQDYLQKHPYGYTCHFERPGWKL